MTYSRKAFLIILALVLLLSFGWAQRAGGGDYIPGQILATSTDTALTASAPPAEELEPKTALRTYPSSAARREASEAAYDRLKAGGKTQDPEEWLLALEWCESRGRPEAVNPVDRDGTPSLGLLQFKDTTFDFFSKAYGIEGELMDPDAQRAIVRRMMGDPSIKWQNQFPDCVKKHIGWPPVVVY